MKISFVTTIYRTMDCVEPFAERAFAVAEAMGFSCEIVFVDDGSPDDGAAVARALAQRDPRVIFVALARNYGQHKALWTGLEHARGDLVMMLDGDLEEDPGWAATFHGVMRETGADVVYGLQSRPKGGFVYRTCRRAFYWLLATLSDVRFPKDVMTARLMTRRYLEQLLRFEERELFLVGVMHVAGFRQEPCAMMKPSLRPTKYTLRKLVWLFVMAVTAFSIRPLLMVFVTGLAISVLSGLFVAYLVVRWAVFGVGVEGWTSVMAALFLVMGLTTSFTGLIAIYVGTIFLEVKRRPRTLIREIVAARPRDAGGS